MKNYIFILSCCLVGCGGTEFTTAIDNVGGETNTGGEHSLAGAAGNETGGSDTGGAVNSGGEAGESTGGMAGLGGSNTGGEPNTGGVISTGGAVTGGTGGSTGGSVNTGGQATGGGSSCVPKTCTELAQEKMNDVNSVDACNVWPDDGCGNAINCGGCERPNTVCGGPILHDLHYPEHRFNTNNQIVYESNTNVCSTGCVYYAKDTFTCGAINGLQNYAYLHCTDNQPLPPQSGCVAAYEGSTKDWCCGGAFISWGSELTSKVRKSDANPQ